METKETIKHLRDGHSLHLFDRKERLFHTFQLNKKAHFICWQRFVSKDRNNWREWNSYLSLKDVLNERARIAINCQEMVFTKH